MELEDKMLADEAHTWWWVFLVTGTIWLIIGFVVLQLNLTSVATVGYLIGAMFVVATVTEFMEASASHGGWKFFHYALAVLFILGALWAFWNPVDTFVALASVLGFLLLFMGTFEIMRALASRPENNLWGLGLAVGILEILLAIWASQRYIPARAELILLWVGFMGIFKGVGHIVMAFVVRKAGKELSAA
jgi:uncharacterized membrane protein HdeD (DUF308 family)